MFIQKENSELNWYEYGKGIILNYKKHKFSIKKSKKFSWFYLNIFRIHDRENSLEYIDIECSNPIIFRTIDKAKSFVQKYCESL